MLPPRRANNESFYIVFSDLLFCTMLIFMMLFVMILALVKPIAPAQASPASSDAPGVELVVAIDVSGSMGEPYAELQQALLDLARNFPQIVDDFSIGIVAYRADFNNGVAVFPLTEIDSASSRKLQTWLGQLSTSPGFVDPVEGLRSAIGQFSRARRGDKTIRSLVLIGDVGPYEPPGSTTWDTVSPRAQAETSKALQLAKDFAAASPSNQVLSMFTYDPANTQVEHFAYSEKFFCQIAESARGQGLFTKTRGSMMWILLESFIPKENDRVTRKAATC